VTSVRDRRVDEVAEAIGSRRLIWFGIRGEDGRMLEALPQFAASYSITAPLVASGLDESLALENLSKHRVELDTYDIDFDHDPTVDEFRQHLLAAMSQPSVVVSYRPSEFISMLGFATRHICWNPGMFKDRQRAFEHKPWVETEIESVGVRTLGWEYLPRERRLRLALKPTGDGLVLRPNRTSGGVGISLVQTRDEAEHAWKDDQSQLMGVAKYLADAVPLNVNGCVFRDGSVRLHPASVQLIGIPSLTSHPFGYCGNDFSALRHLAAGQMEALDQMARQVGGWLASQGYIGAFGADFLVDASGLYFAEVNARMQGSTRMAADLAARTGHLDLLLEHVAAVIGLRPSEDLSLSYWADALPPSAQVIHHNLSETPVPAVSNRDLDLPRGDRATLLAGPGVVVEPGAVSYVVEVRRAVTSTGFNLLDQ